MSAGFTTLQRLHRLCLRHSLYPIVLSSALTLVILLGRFYLGRTLVYGYFAWNLVLAWLPYFFGLLALYWHHRYPRRWLLLIVPVALWLVFFPNAPYVITDLVHLEERARVPIWYDIGFFVTYIWTGLFLTVVSLHTMQGIARDYVGRAGSWLFALMVIGLGGLGVYIGRYIGWNSWDFILQPFEVVADVIEQFAHPLRHPQPFGFTMMFAAFIFVCYVSYVSVPLRHKQ